jgi:hypothetical protein
VSENFENRFSLSEPSQPEQAENRCETFSELGIEPGDVIIRRGRSATWRVYEIVYDPEEVGGGYIEANQTTSDGKPAGIIHRSFQHMLRHQDIIDKIEKYPTDRLYPPEGLHNGEAEESNRVRERFRVLDIRPGDVIHSKSGTQRLVKRVRLSMFCYGGKLETERSDIQGETMPDTVPFQHITDPEASQMWLDSIERRKRE